MQFRAGFARTDITPPAGSEVPGGLRKNLSQGVRDPLHAEAAVFSDGATLLALVGIDALFVPDSVVHEARAMIESRAGVPGGHVLIAASHSHCGGPIVDCFGSSADPEYQRLAARRIAEAVAEAHAAIEDARIAFELGHEDSVGFNRRFKMKDGSVITHPGKLHPDIVEPEGPMDPDVAVLVVENTAGELLGCVVNHALHATTMGSNLHSADYIRFLKETMRGGLGADIGIVFLNGACGDVTQVDNQSSREREFGPVWSRRVGMTLGAEALKAAARASYLDQAELAVVSATLQLPIRDLGESDEALAAREAPAFGLGAGAEDVFLREAQLVREMKALSPRVPVEVQAMRIGPAAVVTNPTEYFCALGLAIKERSPWTPTLIATMANGYAGYCPTEEAFKGGGYETRTARSSFLAPGSGEQILETSVDLLNRL